MAKSNWDWSVVALKSFSKYQAQKNWKLVLPVLFE